MAVRQLKDLRRDFNNGKIKSEEELYLEISKYFDSTKSERYGLACVIFSLQPEIVKRIQKDKYHVGATRLLERFLSGELRTIDVRYYFEVAKQGDHIVERTKSVFGVHFEDFEVEMKARMREWVTIHMQGRGLLSTRQRFRENYAKSCYLSFFESVLSKEFNKNRFGHLLED